MSSPLVYLEHETHKGGEVNIKINEVSEKWLLEMCFHSHLSGQESVRIIANSEIIFLRL